MDARMLDGNAAAGLLQQVFAVEATTMVGVCDSCGAAEAMGTTHVYEGAGTVLRCARCDAVLVTIVRGDGRMWLGVAGLRTLEISVAE